MSPANPTTFLEETMREFDEEFPSGKNCACIRGIKCQYHNKIEERFKSFIRTALTAKDTQIAEAYTRGRCDEAKTCAGCSKERIAEAEKRGRDERERRNEFPVNREEERIKALNNERYC